MNWLYYLAEANIYLCVFYLAYCLFLAKETYYQLNRAYLLLSCVASFILPVIQVGLLKPVEAVTTTSVAYYTIPTQTITTVVNTPQVIESQYTLQDYMLLAYLIGVVVLLLVLLLKLYTLYKLTRHKQSTWQDKHKLIYLPETDVAFSFFNYLFIGTHAAGTHTIIRHELVHIRQKHSADIVFLEVLKVINWFNPGIYLLQNSLKIIHEYIADEQTAAFEGDTLTYSSFLVNNAYGAGGSSITHSFFNYNLLKKRIIMLNQQRSGNLARLKYLATVPICAGLLCTSTLGFSKTYAWVDLAPAENGLRTTLHQPYLTEKHEITAINDEPLKKTSKGYLYEETGYLVKGKENFRVIIHEKDRTEKGYFRNIATPAELKLLKDKYGYTFPIMKIYEGPPPPVTPSFTKPGFEGLQHHIMKTISYGPADNERGDFVVVGFTVTDSHKLTAAKVERSAGSKFDAPTLNAFKTYSLSLPAKPGNYKAVVLFYNNQESSAAYKVSGNNPSYIALWSISNFTYKLKRTVKGYEYDEYAQRSSENDSKIFYWTIIYEKDGKYTSVNSNKATPDEIKLLKDKYGYAFPNGNVLPPPPPAKPKTAQVKFPPPVIRRDSAMVRKDGISEFYKYVTKHVRYPAKARDNNVEARTYAHFTVDNNHRITNVTMTKGPSELLNNEVSRVLQEYGTLASANTSKTYTLPVCFVIADADGKVPYEKPQNYKLPTNTTGLPADNNVVLDEVVIVSYLP